MKTGVLNFDDSASPASYGYTFYKGNARLPNKKSDPLPTPASAITRNAFLSPVNVMMTALHELDHFESRKLAAATVKRWRASKTNLQVRPWLVRQGQRGLSSESVLRILELYNQGDALSESAARIAGFVGCYHAFPLVAGHTRLPPGKRNAPFIQLGDIWRFWRRLDASMKPVLLKRLNRYATALPRRHRDELVAFLRRKQRYGHFYVATLAAIAP